VTKTSVVQPATALKHKLENMTYKNTHVRYTFAWIR